MATATEPTPAGSGAATVGPRSRLGRIDPAIVALTILGFALAAYRLGSKSMWLDESVSADHARLGLSSLWTVITSHDPNMGLYYLLLHFWVRIFGYGEAAVRSMTVVLAGFSVPVMYLLGRRLFGRTAGLIAGLLLAVAPLFVQYEQTARAYALVVLLTLLSSCFFVAELEKHSRRTLVGYVLASALAVYAHYFAALVLLVQALTLFAVKRRGVVTATWLSAGAGVVALCAPAAVFAKRAGTANISWIRTPSFGSLFHLPSDLAGGRALALALILLGCYGFVRAVVDRGEWQAGFVAAWLIVPVLLVFAVSRLGRPLFVAYYLIIVLPALLLLGALGVSKLPRREASWLAAGLLLALSVVGVRDWYSRSSLEDYRAATHYILSRERPGDGGVYYPPGTLRGPTSGLDYYASLAGARVPTEVKLGLTPAASRVTPAGSGLTPAGSGPTPAGSSLAEGLRSRPPRIWLVLRRSDTSAQVQRELQSTLGSGYRQAGAQADFRNLIVLLYRMSGT